MFYLSLMAERAKVGGYLTINLLYLCDCFLIHTFLVGHHVDDLIYCSFGLRGAVFLG